MNGINLCEHRPGESFSESAYGKRGNRRITHQRISYLILGLSILTALLADHWFKPVGRILLVGMVVNLVQYFFTGYCGIKNFMDRLRIPYEQPPWERAEDNREKVAGKTIAHEHEGGTNAGPGKYERMEVRHEAV